MASAAPSAVLLSVAHNQPCTRRVMDNNCNLLTSFITGKRFARCTLYKLVKKCTKLVNDNAKTEMLKCKNVQVKVPEKMKFERIVKCSLQSYDLLHIVDRLPISPKCCYDNTRSIHLLWRPSIGHFVWLVQSPGTVYHWTFVRHLSLSTFVNNAQDTSFLTFLLWWLTVSRLQSTSSTTLYGALVVTRHVTAPYKLSFYYYYYLGLPCMQLLLWVCDMQLHDSTSIFD